MSRISELEMKFTALRGQFIALQLVMIKLLPVISTASTAQFDAAITAAMTAAETALPAAGFAEADIQCVLDELDALREDMGGNGRWRPPC